MTNRKQAPVEDQAKEQNPTGNSGAVPAAGNEVVSDAAEAKSTSGTIGKLTDETGFTSRDVQDRLINQLTASAFFGMAPDRTAYSDFFDIVIPMLRDFAPRDPAEGLLIQQMIGAAETAMTCLNMANNPQNPQDIRLEHHKLAQRYMKLYQDQMLALDKHRNRGKQKIKVEHVNVNVNEGVQAIGGNITSRKQAETAEPKLAIDYNPAEQAPMALELPPAKKSEKKKA